MRSFRGLTALFACAWAGAVGKPPAIACSFSIPADWTKQLVGDGAAVMTLAGPNTDLHAYQPNPRAIHLLLQADLIVGINPSLEPWLKELCESNKLNDKVLWLSTIGGSSHGEPGHRCDDPAHADQDPHVWMDPSLVLTMVEALAERCRKLPGISATDIDSRQARYVRAIRTLDEQIRADFDRIPADRRVIITHHGNLGRFADRYGIRVAGVVLRSTSTESADPSARALAELVRLCRTSGVRIVTCDRGQRAPAAVALAREAGLPSPIELSVDALDAPGTPAGSWLGLMQDNAARLAAALDNR